MTKPLPELQDSVIDHATFRQYVDDLNMAAKILDVRLRGHDAARAQDNTTDLTRGVVLFEGKDVGGLQVKYLYEGLEWWDTLMWVGENIRLIRIAHDWDAYALDEDE